MSNLITVENKKLHDWIVTKDKLVDEGRANEKLIEAIEKQIEDFKKQEQEITSKITPDPKLVEEGDRLAKEIEGVMKRLGEIGNLIEQGKLDAIPKDMIEKHRTLLKEKEEKERVRNKIALKVQKIKDRCVPLIKGEVKPFLKAKKLKEIDIGRFNDIETATTKDGKVNFRLYNRLEEFMSKFQ